MTLLGLFHRASFHMVSAISSSVSFGLAGRLSPRFAGETAGMRLDMNKFPD